MATIGATDYPAYGLHMAAERGMKVLAGGFGRLKLAEADVILHGMERVYAAIITYNEAPGTDEQAWCDLGTAGQVTITDLAANKDLSIFIIGQ